MVEPAARLRLQRDPRERSGRDRHATPSNGLVVIADTSRGRLVRPGVTAGLGDHEARIRALEREARPDAAPIPPGSGTPYWLTGGYTGAVLATSGLLNYYKFLDSGTETYLDDSYGGPLLTPLATQPGAATRLAYVTDVGGPPQIDASDVNAVQFPHAEPGSSTNVHQDTLIVTNPSGNQTAKWGGGNVSTFSWEAWINPGGSQGNIGGSVPPQGPIIDGVTPNVLGSTGCALEAFYNPLGATPIVRFVDYSSGMILVTTALAAGTWYHVVATADATTGEYVLYVNGVSVARSTTKTATAKIATGWQIGGGSRVDGTLGTIITRNFCGTVGAVGWYNRALTPGEVLIHYNATGASTDPGHWIDLGFSSGALVGAGTIDTAQIADGAVTSAKIRAGGVGTAQLADSGVTSTKILDGTIVAADISGTLKPSGTAADATEALRALGTTAGKATNGRDGRAAKATAVYSASITPDSSAGQWQTITATNGTAFAINAPSNPPGSTETQELTIEISNASGGALGAVTWNAIFVFTNGAFTSPATGLKRHVTFGWNGTAWIEKSRANADY